MAAKVAMEFSLGHLESATAFYVGLFTYETFYKLSTSLFVHLNYLKLKELSQVHHHCCLSTALFISYTSFVVLRMFLYWLTDLAMYVIYIGQVRDAENQTGRTIFLLEYVAWQGDLRWSNERKQLQWLWIDPVRGDTWSAQRILVIVGGFALLVFTVLGSLLMIQVIVQLSKAFGPDPEVRGVRHTLIANLICFVLGLLTTLFYYIVKQPEVHTALGTNCYCYALHTDTFINAFFLLLLSGLPQGALHLWRQRRFNGSQAFVSDGQSAFARARRLACLKQAKRDIHQEYGYDLSAHLTTLETAMTESMVAYTNAKESILRTCKNETFTELQSVSNQHLYHVGNKAELKCEKEMLGVAPEVVRQKTSCLDDLLLEADQVQQDMKQKMAPETTWATSKNAGETPGDESQKWFDWVVDPGVKKRPRIEAKASYKYRDPNGQIRYDRVRDIARLAIQFETPKRLLTALPTIRNMFDIVDIENRFSDPTVLGWSDMTLLVNVDGHVAEMQLQLKAYAEARKEAHRHYNTIRTLLPELGVAKEDEEAVLYKIVSCCQL
eukprot:gnl/TRDRNA2_/TRDRNA2_93338_c0_seq1.p1 gnl/TRDRNA2_/TRDRNA2_93338_c0~~gnl/TRDRNA2_/TRDRNA2_93338_c0_seq1.p1  ORF type:complete len:624 (+),score=77.65 gnl/TRDRNA2_/TRDRNA2_93338_c0_seq1:219-1874(+)